MVKKEDVISYCESNRTSERDIAQKFGFSSRYEAKKFLKENNISYNPKTKEDIFSKTKITKNSKVTSNIDPEEVRKYCSENETSQRELVDLFKFSSRQALITFLDLHSIEYNTLSRKDVNEKIKSTWKSKNQVDIEIINRKRNMSIKEMYGVDHALQSQELKDKMKSNNIDKFGVSNPFQSDELMSERKEKMMDKFGVEFNFEREEVREKIKETNMERYGVEYISMNKEKHMENMMKAHETLKSMGKEGSKFETDVRDWVKSLGLETKKHHIVQRDRFGKIRKVFEIDIYIESKKIGIECNGNYYHKEGTVDKNYHYDKSKAAEAEGIRIIHILEAYWKNPSKRAIYESIIRNATGHPIKKIRASKCEIKTISPKEAKEFFEANHLGGYVPSKISYGLFLDDELVQAELFGKSRFSKSIEWESIRGCSKLGYMIYGGYEKVLKHFKSEYNPESIVSYVDYNVFSGTLHDHAGFKFIKYTGPDHWFLNSKNELKRYWIVRGNKDSDMKWKEERDKDIKFTYWFSGSKVYIWRRDGIY